MTDPDPPPMPLAAQDLCDHHFFHQTVLPGGHLSRTCCLCGITHSEMWYRERLKEGEFHKADECRCEMVPDSEDAVTADEEE